MSLYFSYTDHTAATLADSLRKNGVHYVRSSCQICQGLPWQDRADRQRGISCAERAQY